MKKKQPLFIANDQNEKNSYGFFVDTSGIDLKSRFEQNPICLNNHNNDTQDVLGTWIDIEIKEGKLLMRPDFDTQEERGLEVARKVEAGIIKGCSLGIMFNPEDMINDNGKVVLKKCVLFEVSIVAVPSNANAIALFTMNGEKLSEQEVQSLCLQLQTPKPFENQNNMKIILTHLQLPEGSTEEVILSAIKDTEAKLTASQNEVATLKAENQALKDAENGRNKAELEAELALAVKDGRIDEAGKAPILELTHESAMKLLKSLPIRKTVKEQMQDGEGKKPYEGMNFQELRAKNLLVKLKAEDPELYAEKFEEEFGKKPADYKSK